MPCRLQFLTHTHGPVEAEHPPHIPTMKQTLNAVTPVKPDTAVLKGMRRRMVASLSRLPHSTACLTQPPASLSHRTSLRRPASIDHFFSYTPLPHKVTLIHAKYSSHDHTFYTRPYRTATCGAATSTSKRIRMSWQLTHRCHGYLTLSCCVMGSNENAWGVHLHDMCHVV